MNNKTLELYKWLKESGQNDFVHPKLVKNIWVIHFGEISNILKANGFTLGEPNFEKLNSTDSYEKTEEGFNFAYRLNDITELASRACINQGEQKAIVFKCSGILAYHQTDSDPSNEVIFYGSDADLSNYYILEYNKMECYGKIYREWKFSDKNGNNIDIYYNKVLGEYTSYIPYNKLSKTLTKYFKNLNEIHMSNRLDRIISENVNRFLKENASSLLYHYIDGDNLIRLLNKNEFLTCDPEMYYDNNTEKMEYINGKGIFFLSFTRNKNPMEGYPVLKYGEFGSGNRYIMYRIEINGDNLNRFSNFKDKDNKKHHLNVKPMDWEYYDTASKGDAERMADNTYGNIFAQNGKEHMMGLKDLSIFRRQEFNPYKYEHLDDLYTHSMSQSEDRLTTDARFIPNANKYINRIDVLINPNQEMIEDMDSDEIVEINTIYNKSNRLNIPVYIYTTIKDFSKQTNNTLTIDELDSYIQS